MSAALFSQIERQRSLLRFTARKSLAHFLSCITIPSTPEPKLFDACADEWQREMLAPKLPAFEHLCGKHPNYSGPLQFMDILARGHNKSSLEAWLCTYCVTASQRHIHGYILAADRDQGRLILQAQEDLIRLNPWLADDVHITKDVIAGPCGEITVLPCDAGSSMGLRGNLYIADEIVHWKRQKEWSAIVTGLPKVQPTIFAVLSNAGLEGSWQHEAFLEAQSDPKSWSVFYREGTLATWQDPEAIRKARRLIPPSEGDRLFDNKWIDPTAEHDYLRRSELAQCARLGEELNLRLRTRKQYGVGNYVVGIDYGARRDRTALCVLHMDQNNRTIIDRLDVWQGTPENQIKIADVQEWIEQVERAFSPCAWVVDPAQMEGTIQWMAGRGLPVVPWAARGGKANYEMAMHLRAIVVEQKLAWYPNAGCLDVKDVRTGREFTERLEDELVALRVKKMPYGFRFDHENQKHDDRAVAVTMAALKALEYPALSLSSGFVPSPVSVRPPDDRLDR